MQLTVRYVYIWEVVYERRRIANLNIFKHMKEKNLTQSL